MQPRLGVNIDHVATLRQLRKTPYPNTLLAAQLAQKGGADQITVHLREDRRHIQIDDVKILRGQLEVPLNLEMAVTEEMVRFAVRVKPRSVCLVPEKRQEVTTEGGLDLSRSQRKIAKAIERMRDAEIHVSCFIEPNLASVKLSKKLGANAVEFHTGRYCLPTQKKATPQTESQAQKELLRIHTAAVYARDLGIYVHAGHGLDYHNVSKLVGLKNSEGAPLIEEYNIGHSIVCRATMVGMEQAVREMIGALTSA